MPEFKIVISDPHTGKSVSKELKDKPAQSLLGMKIGQEFNATILGIDGTVKIRGGSDKVGFPMRHDVHGGVRKRILITAGVGFNGKIRKIKQKGLKKRKLVRGNVITDEIYQVNTILTKGALPKPEEKPTESKPEEKPTESKPEDNIPETSDTKTK